jgi:preprotein translocase SecE subunit
MADQVQNSGTPVLPTASGQVERERERRPAAPSGVSPFAILKPGQGIHVRWATAIGAGVLSVGFAHFVWNKIQLIRFIEQNFAVRAAIPVLVLLFLAWLIFRLVGQQARIVDFLIATEGEMKKVNWSSRKEVWGATRVVIFTVLALAMILFVVDMLFIFFFGAIGVLKGVSFSSMFGGGS